MGRPGELVTREELRQRLWPEGTFVDYDHSINAAVNRLREGRGDSAAEPRVIETLAGRGYRLLAPVQRVNPGPAETVIATSSSRRSRSHLLGAVLLAGSVVIVALVSLDVGGL